MRIFINNQHTFHIKLLNMYILSQRQKGHLLLIDNKNARKDIILVDDFYPPLASSGRNQTTKNSLIGLLIFILIDLGKLLNSLQDHGCWRGNLSQDFAHVHHLEEVLSRHQVFLEGSEHLDTPGDDGLVVGAQPLGQRGAPVLVRQERHPSPHLPDEQIDESPEENQLFVSIEVQRIARDRSPLSCAHMAGGNQALEDTEARRRPLLKY